MDLFKDESLLWPWITFEKFAEKLSFNKQLLPRVLLFLDEKHNSFNLRIKRECIKKGSVILQVQGMALDGVD
jgi:hypothetical protein